MFQTQRKACAEVRRREHDPLGGLQVLRRGWERFPGVTWDWAGDRGGGERPSCQALERNGRGTRQGLWLQGGHRVAQVGPKLPASQQVCVFSGP